MNHQTCCSIDGRTNWLPSQPGEVKEGNAARRSQYLFFGIIGALFAVATAVTISWCGPMSEMDGMSMPGGWTMSMAWMRMPGQTWLTAGAAFLGMWTVMMTAMMLPSLTPMLWRYRRTIHALGQLHQAFLTALVALGYFFVWLALGAATYPLGVALAAMEMAWPALAQMVPVAIGATVMMAGALQFSDWKARHLACCRDQPETELPSTPSACGAWQHGLRLGLHCCFCCAPMTIILLVIGVMDLGTMAVVTAAITIERLIPSHERCVQLIGAAITAAGLLLIAQASWAR